MKTDRAGLAKVIYRGCPEIVSSRSIQVTSVPVSSRGFDRHLRASLTELHNLWKGSLPSAVLS